MSLRFLLENLIRVGKKYDLELFLVGSRARGDHVKGSDIDILVFIPDELWSELGRIRLELKRAVNFCEMFEFHVYKKSWREIKEIFYQEAIPLEEALNLLSRREV